MRAAPGPISFIALTCRSANFCVNLGFAADVQRWDGSKWQLTDTPEPKGATDMGLSGVSCPSASFCMAVGAYATDSDAQIHQSVAEIWNGSAWKLIASPSHQLESSLTDVACTSPTHCMAVGGFFSKKSSTNIAALWDGKAWHVTEIPGTVGFGYGYDDSEIGPAAISCPTASDCMAVGGQLDNQAGQPLPGTARSGSSPSCAGRAAAPSTCPARERTSASRSATRAMPSWPSAGTARPGSGRRFPVRPASRALD